MKKLMKVTTVLVLNFLVLSYSFNNFYNVDSSIQRRGPASVSDRTIATVAAKKSWSFNYKDLTKKPFSIKKEAISYEEAYKSASHDCYQQLTHGRYPGEEKGLDIIDICANPKI